MATKKVSDKLTAAERRELAEIKLELGVGDDLGRPRYRSDCKDVPRPCPYVGCVYNNFLDVNSSGVIQYRHPGKNPWDMDPALSCALDVADRWGTKGTTALVVSATGVGRNTTAQVIKAAMSKIVDAMDFDTVNALLDAIDDKDSE